MLFTRFLSLALAAIYAAAQEPDPDAWWKEAVCYQIYPSSFRESRTGEDAIGWGDINGITSKLDHLTELGVDIVWLSPFYDSPMKDMGYDISDYNSVNPIFGGSLADIRRFISEAKKRGLRVLFDLVINHTSNRHPWFRASKSSRDDPYRDWYFWRKGQMIDGEMYPPNNWAGNNNGSAWKYDPDTEEYYLNIFNPWQPDLNWQNPVMRRSIFYEALVFWLQEGIDGFRMDAFAFLSKPPGLPDVPSDNNTFLSGQVLYQDGPNEHEYLQQMHREVLSHYDTFTVGEYGTTYDMDVVQNYTSASRKEIDTVFLTQMVDLGRDGFEIEPFNLTGWRDAINFTQAVGDPSLCAECWNSVFLENHDLPRSVSRFANESPEYRVQSGRVLAMFLSTLSGTLFLYQQQEIGMVNVPKSWEINNYRDVYSTVYYEDEVEEGDASPSKILAQLQRLSRDNARTPFNWNSDGGFSTNETSWIPAHHLEINLADQRGDDSSVYEFWREMVAFRKQHKALFIYGGFEFLDMDSEQFLVYQKTSDSARAMVVLNMSEQEGVPPVGIPEDAELVAQTHDASESSFQAYEGRVYVLSS